ncbi:MAG: hypothetical protein J7641_05445 [Cyanobacteria bacterium SID2]|nr:hypothetical protein [Cyanobacteria bacterium SID2]
MNNARSITQRTRVGIASPAQCFDLQALSVEQIEKPLALKRRYGNPYPSVTAIHQGHLPSIAEDR